MKLQYVCSFCNELFDNPYDCEKHEMEHMSTVEQKKYYIEKVLSEDLCSHCKNAYFVYGCELSCEKKNCNSFNHYEEFEPMEGI